MDANRLSVPGSNMIVSDYGTLNVLWYSAGKNGDTGIYSSESKDNGISFGPRVLVASGETHGTPVLLKYEQESKAVWEGGGQIMTAPLAIDGSRPNISKVISGSLPAAVETSSHLIVAYVATGEQHQAVWIVSSKG